MITPPSSPPTPAATTANASPPAAAEQPAWARHWVIVGACLVAASLFAVTVVILYRGWLVNEDNTSMIIVQGDAATADAIVTLRGPTLRNDLRGQFQDTDDYRLRFMVPSGRYTLEIARKGQVLLKELIPPEPKPPIDAQHPMYVPFRPKPTPTTTKPHV